MEFAVQCVLLVLELCDLLALLLEALALERLGVAELVAQHTHVALERRARAAVLVKLELAPVLERIELHRELVALALGVALALLEATALVL